MMELGYGHLVDEKLRNLGWTEDQLNFFLDHLHNCLEVDTLVQLLLEVAPADVIESIADGAGVFELGDGEEDE